MDARNSSLKPGTHKDGANSGEEEDQQSHWHQQEECQVSPTGRDETPRGAASLGRQNVREGQAS
jgi:hypothetical protein